MGSNMARRSLSTLLVLALLAKNAISRERSDTAHDELLLADAGGPEARALVTRKRLEPDFATRRSPINGHVSAGLADIGGLAAPGGDGALAAVQALYTVFVDLRLPADVLDAALIAAADGLGPLRLLVSWHGAAPLTGLVRSSDVIVDPGNR
ncbi:hypothetical protein DDE23_09580 [Pararhodobacter aggregans]|uniref:Uncharacterized protein n=2 Tax=Pararhodobacter aggregans TaxID=404875 RepID=A0A2T7USP8_9RHOB|nr:hypothetical protein C8N33_103193 [Pararhodobacter aggregans]PVE47684.1 hypothetical protein DDE23_09580 [Pararhodobacter aggregans]